VALYYLRESISYIKVDENHEAHLSYIVSLEDGSEWQIYPAEYPTSVAAHGQISLQEGVRCRVAATANYRRSIRRSNVAIEKHVPDRLQPSIRTSEKSLCEKSTSVQLEL
jgi:hypothetical protein